jgi:uncharacterized PurR-regulated membrane protein YhhQ (DUF165 family)
VNLTAISVVIYAVAMTAANLLIAEFGKPVVLFNAFFLIGLDLALRDWLHTRLSRWQMLILIACAGVLTFLLNPAAGKFAVASACAFGAAALVDWAVFTYANGSWQRRANVSNVAGAAVDSLVFPLLAFGSLSLSIGMFAAKVAGGAVWAWVLSRHMQTEPAK